LSIDLWKILPQITPNYSRASKQQFKKLSCQINPSQHSQPQHHLSNPNLMSMRFQLEMEKDN
jgi:hypothetical protein